MGRLILLSCLLLNADEPAYKGDLAKFQGTWTAKIGPQKDVLAVATIKGTRVSITMTKANGETMDVTCEINIQEQAKPHKTIDWVKYILPNGKAGRDMEGIYEFQDDNTLRVCNGGPRSERPEEFKEGEKGPPQLILFKRVREGDSPK